MLSNHAGLTSRSSSTVLSMAHTIGIQDPISTSVAQELLNRPNHTRQRSGFTIKSARSQQFDGTENHQQIMKLSADPISDGRRRAGQTSNTWTSSSGDVLSDQDEFDDRTFFVQEYNRLAKKHGVRVIVPEEHEPNDDSLVSSAKQASWFSRKILRRTSFSQSIRVKNDRHLKHMRSISDSLRPKKRDRLKDKDLQDLARLCGLSLLYLPTEYAAGSLSVPTCLRATAQFLVQHAPSTRGVFRIPGSQNAVAALYNHYCSMDEEGQAIAGTVRCPTLPDHIRCDTHDVASAFKRFLAGLPGGILGSLALFNALISIQTQLDGDAELTRTKQSKVRARLIALAVATLRSQYRRELICAVFGLLSMIGRAAETAPREDERGRPLPTSDLMGYGPLGIVFGPLLVGDLLEDYTVRLVNPHGGLILLPISPPKSRKERSKKTKGGGDEGTTFSNHVNKIKVANSIAEMLITHWRDVVRHMKNLSALKVVAGTQSLAVRNSNTPMLRPSASETFALRKPPDWGQFGSPLARRERSISPTPNRRRSGAPDIQSDDDTSLHHLDMLRVKKQRMKQKIASYTRVSGQTPKTVLSPTREESPKDVSSHHAQQETSESILRSGSESSPEDEIIRVSHHNPGKGEAERHQRASNSSSDKENKPPLTNYRSVLDRGRPKLEHRDGNVRAERGELTSTNISDEAKEAQPKHHIKIGSAESRSETSNCTRQKSSEESTSAKADKTNTTPQTLRQSPSSTTRGLAKSSTDELRNSKRESPRGPNKLVKSVERAYARDIGRKTKHQNSRTDKEATPYKNWKRDKHAGLNSSKSETDTSNHPIPGDIHDEFWPFDHMPSSTISYHPHHLNVEITVSRSSSRDPGDINSRRLGGSEPGLHPNGGGLAARSFRRISRSLDDNLRRRSKPLDLQKLSLSKDPLSRISHEEDLASLAELAQALDSVDAPPQSPDHFVLRGHGPTMSVQYTGTIEYQSHVSSRRSTLLRREISNSAKSGGNRDSPKSDQYHSREQSGRDLGLKKSASTDGNPSLMKSPKQTQEVATAGHTVVLQEKPARVPTSLDHRTVQFTLRKRTGSLRSLSSNISALVAKYNNEDAVPILPSGTPSPSKSLAPSVSKEPSGKVDTSQEKLVAPYTINPPTPKPGKSDKSPQTRRTPDLNAKPSNFERNVSPTKIPAPRRVLRSSLDDSTPLRHVQKSAEKAKAPNNSPSKIPRSRFGSPEPQQGYFDGPASKDTTRTSSQVLDPRQLDTSAVVVQRLARSTSRTLTPPPKNRRSLDEIVTDINGPVPSLLRPAILRSVREVTEFSIENHTVEGSPSDDEERQVSSDSTAKATAVDGPASELKIHPYARRSNPSLPTCITQPITKDLPEFIHPDSPFVDTFSHPSSPVLSPTLGRSNSVLYMEVKRLGKQLSKEREEVLRLKQQLDARSNFDVGSLSEELRQAKKELQKWKTRAELAEKQLELGFRLPSRSASTQLAYSSMARVSDRIDSSRTDGPSDDLTAMKRLPKGFNGTDEVASSEESDNSTSTVVRDVRDVVSGIEYSIWVEQTVNALEAAETS